jgi:hypothetical protein
MGLPCMNEYVRYWHFSDIPPAPTNVRTVWVAELSLCRPLCRTLGKAFSCLRAAPRMEHSGQYF